MDKVTSAVVLDVVPEQELSVALARKSACQGMHVILDGKRSWTIFRFGQFKR